jgi:hypothetical protein
MVQKEILLKWIDQYVNVTDIHVRSLHVLVETELRAKS